jgi:hypothetical protein
MLSWTVSYRPELHSAHAAWPGERHIASCPPLKIGWLSYSHAAYAASRISSNLKGSTKQFGWLQAPARNPKLTVDAASAELHDTNCAACFLVISEIGMLSTFRRAQTIRTVLVVSNGLRLPRKSGPGSNKGHDTVNLQYSCGPVGCHLRRKVVEFVVSHEAHKPKILWQSSSLRKTAC